MSGLVVSLIVWRVRRADPQFDLWCRRPSRRFPLLWCGADVLESVRRPRLDEECLS